MVDFMYLHDGLRDAQIASKIFFLGVSVREFVEEISIWSELSKVVK